ncbi:pyridoxamine 5'-phosphate oxidase family protein [Compostibacter hankyongensis]|uniref:Pyridoxamine 5'-phosphate oxidase family protein n=1 Tax=Compostibacter hankyongensis TaxID=1007089 RepID=A0ABP8FWJ2_9BACT
MLGILNKDEITHLLEKNAVGRIGCSDGLIMQIIPVTYLYDGKYIIIHSKEGLKIRVMREHPNVCFEVDEVENLSNWKSVIVWGKYEEITDKRERYYALDRLIRKINKEKISETAAPEGFLSGKNNIQLADDPKSVVYRIRVDKISGRFERRDQPL